MREAILSGLPIEKRYMGPAVPKVGHDLARFDQRRKVRETFTEREHIDARERAKARKLRKAKNAYGVSAFTVVGAIVVISLMIMIIFSNVRLTEISDETAKLKNELKSLKSQESELRSEYERSINLEGVESSAETLYGMTKPGREQIIYLDLSKPDYAEIIEHDEIENIKDNLLGIKENFSLFLEYLK